MNPVIQTNFCFLCKNPTQEFNKDVGSAYHRCSVCEGISMNRELLPTAEQEIIRYKEHNNDVYDIRYQNFVKPIVNSILNDFKPNDKGLDFGAGTGPVISKMLSDKNYCIEQYDPFFHNYPEILNKTFSYIACCEVIEHFHNPNIEFGRLYSMLEQNGKLYCKTILYNNKHHAFSKWHYILDPTHVFLYTEKTLRYIQEKYGFSELDIQSNIITFTK